MFTSAKLIRLDIKEVMQCTPYSLVYNFANFYLASIIEDLFLSVQEIARSMWKHTWNQAI